MSKLLNGNENGTIEIVSHVKRKLTRSQFSTPMPETRETQVVFQTNEGISLQGVPLRIARHSLVFELYNPAIIPQFSEAFNDFRIDLQTGTNYAGRAVVRSVVDGGIKIICEVTLDDHSWTISDLGVGTIDTDNVQSEFKILLQNWQKYYRVNKDYKAVISDLYFFMADLHSWLNKLELQIHSLPAVDQIKAKQDTVYKLRDSVLASMDNLFQRFEDTSNNIEKEFLPIHRVFGQRLLHPFMLSSPFLRRTYTKPLGFAGDYEMMNMIVRNEMEGDSFLGKLANAYLLAQAAPRAVRNRVSYLSDKIIEETSRVARLARSAKISSIACGPAWEVVNILSSHPLANHAQFQLLDFDAETLQYVTTKTNEAKRLTNCKAVVKTVKKSVQSLLRSNGRETAEKDKFDLIYCSGLYDYLSDSVCLALNNYLYNSLLPGGLLVVGNFSPQTPHQHIMEHFAEWFLTYRDSGQLAALAPEQALKDNCCVRAEPTGSNIFLEVRKLQ